MIKAEKSVSFIEILIVYDVFMHWIRETIPYTKNKISQGTSKYQIIITVILIIIQIMKLF